MTKIQTMQYIVIGLRQSDVQSLNILLCPVLLFYKATPCLEKGTFFSNIRVQSKQYLRNLEITYVKGYSLTFFLYAFFLKNLDIV